MTVSTMEFTIDEEAYARVLTRSYFKRNAWSYAWFGLLAAVGLFMRIPSVVAIGLGPGVALALYRMWWFRRFTRDPDNTSFFEPRRYTFTDDMLEASTFDGTEVRQPIGSLIRAERGDEHWKLFISKGQFHYIPFSAFASEADEERLATILAAHRLG